ISEPHRQQEFLAGRRGMPRRRHAAQATALGEEGRIADVLVDSLDLGLRAGTGRKVAQGSAMQSTLVSLVQREVRLNGHSRPPCLNKAGGENSLQQCLPPRGEADGFGPVRNTNEDACSPEGMVL